MFLHRFLDPEASVAVAALARHIFHASGGLTAREARLLIVMYAELGLEIGDLSPEGDVDELAHAIRHPRARAAALLELYRLASADGPPRGKEQALLERIADAWRAPPETRQWVASWVDRHLRHVDEAESWIDQAGTG